MSTEVSVRYGKRSMDGDVDVASAAALIGDSTRAAFLLALSEADALPASELAARAEVSAPTASAHLARLVGGGLVAAERRGRHRYFRLADPAVATALEALSVIAPTHPVRSLRDADRTVAIRAARTCYDHLAGRLGVSLTEALEERALIARRDGEFSVTRRGQRELADLGLDVGELMRERRAFARACLDWSERRYHLAGAVGAALANRCFELGWIERRGTGRAVALTPAGETELRQRFGLRLDE
jgi:DNA-binding transcriptional ArsR family regulator